MSGGAAWAGKKQSGASRHAQAHPPSREELQRRVERQISLRRWPIAQRTFFSIALDFFEKKIEPAAGRVAVQLPIPKRLIAFAQPFRNSPEVLRRKLTDCRLYLLNPVHPLRLAQSLRAAIVAGREQRLSPCPLTLVQRSPHFSFSLSTSKNSILGGRTRLMLLRDDLQITRSPFAM